ncbi:type II secretion system protein M [Neiella marina]|uniref:Type II secretion system protein M n=1 Tax=Neiella holothuriorum TaxID=2870530 RepID=A0ABS7EB05_9GAMM|nr:type II secretion system protein GspM [Neiella holothuriorum]MBW8189435.1 type II secretion system protein M [Neiella holothuriorum]
MNEQLQKLESRYNEMTPRERGLIFGAGLVLISMVLYSLWIGPNMDRAASLERKLASQQQDSETLTRQIDMLKEALNRDPNEATQHQLDEQNEHISKLDTELKALTVDLVAAEQMLPVLRSLLATSRDVSLIGLTSIPGEPVLAAQDEADTDIGMYRHGVTIEVSGSFFDIYRLLESIEASPWRFYWQAFDYQVAEYPNAKVRIVLYTLSTNEDYIRV